MHVRVQNMHFSFANVHIFASNIRVPGQIIIQFVKDRKAEQASSASPKPVQRIKAK
jgi:hypothetical protein